MEAATPHSSEQDKSFSGPIGILGGGQLGMMLCQASIGMGLELHVLDPDPNCSCKTLAASHTIGSFQDYETVLSFGRQFRLVTVEIEAVNTQALAQLQQEGVLVFPRPEHLALIQDKAAQKQWYKQHGIPSAPFVLTNSREELTQHAKLLPAVHKLARDGYDGRGVVKLNTLEDALSSGFDAPAVLEQAIDIFQEFSLLVARNEQGQVAIYPAVEQVFHPTRHVLQYLVAPAAITDEQQATGISIARQIVEELNYVGLLAIEFFVDTTGRVLVNEMAPRPHNSGHHTIKACHTSQFEQHLRAISGMPLGSTEQHSYAGILNILGKDGHTGNTQYQGLEAALDLPGVFPFLYGKPQTRPFRKMGHVTVVAKDKAQLLDLLERVKVEAVAQ